MSNLFYPEMLHADLSLEVPWATDIVEYETGHTQLNSLWTSPKAKFKLHYNILSEAQYKTLRNFFDQHHGAYESFWFTDYTERDITDRLFAMGDGTTLVFKLPIDAADALVVYRNGIVDGLAIIDLGTGVVSYVAAPAVGARLTFDATNARYRVRFGNDSLPGDRHKFMAWGGEISLVQVKPYA